MKALIFSIFSALVISACGGSDSSSSAPAGLQYSGITSAAIISSSNGEELSTKAAEASEKAVAQDAANDSNPFAISISQPNSNIDQLVINIARQIDSQSQSYEQLSTGITLNASDLGYPFCGGSVSVPDSWQNTNTLNGTMSFNNLCVDDPYFGTVTINGSVTFSETSTQITMSYNNFSINDGSTTQTINMTITCDSSLTTCTISSNYIGADGKTYRIADLSITGNNTGPYTISATFYHPDFGYANISGSGIYLNCPDNSPSAGTIIVNGANSSSASITFAGCNSYSGTWNDGTSSGIF